MICAELVAWCSQEEIRADMTPIEHYPVFAESTKDLIYAQNKEDPVVFVFLGSGVRD